MTRVSHFHKVNESLYTQLGNMIKAQYGLLKYDTRV